jgi:hypothetical protein
MRVGPFHESVHKGHKTVNSSRSDVIKTNHKILSKIYSKFSFKR